MAFEFVKPKLLTREERDKRFENLKHLILGELMSAKPDEVEKRGTGLPLWFQEIIHRPVKELIHDEQLNLRGKIAQCLGKIMEQKIAMEKAQNAREASIHKLTEELYHYQHAIGALESWEVTEMMVRKILNLLDIPIDTKASFAEDTAQIYFLELILNSVIDDEFTPIQDFPKNEELRDKVLTKLKQIENKLSQKLEELTGNASIPSHTDTPDHQLPSVPPPSS